jgi:hypothetical protein
VTVGLVPAPQIPLPLPLAGVHLPPIEHCNAAANFQVSGDGCTHPTVLEDDVICGTSFSTSKSDDDVICGAYIHSLTMPWDLTHHLQICDVLGECAGPSSVMSSSLMNHEAVKPPTSHEAMKMSHDVSQCLTMSVNHFPL